VNNMDYQLVQKATCKLKMTKCSWNVVKLDNSHNMWGGKGQDFFLLCTNILFKFLLYFVKWGIFWKFAHILGGIATCNVMIWTFPRVVKEYNRLSHFYLFIMFVNVGNFWKLMNECNIDLPFFVIFLTMIFVSWYW
jgi:hypothetical protein